MEPQMQRLLHALRLFGAAMVVAASGTFLVQSWDAVGDVARYLALLGMTTALPALAYVCGIRLREDRSARVLLITLLSLMPIHVGILAGFVFSQFGGAQPSLNRVAQWVAPNPVVAIALVVGAAMVLIPLMWTAYRALSRAHAKELTVVSSFAYGLLLLPDRTALAASLLIGPTLAAAAYGAARAKPATREAKIAVASLFGPAALLLARQVVFYDVSAAFWSVVFGACAAGLFTIGHRTRDNTLTRFAAMPALLASSAFFLAVVDTFFERWNLHLSMGAMCLVFGVIAAAPLGVFARISAPSRRFFASTAAGLNALLVGLVVLFEPTPLAALEAIALGLALGSYGYLRKRPLALYCGVALVVPGFVVEIDQAVRVFSSGGWLALATFGLGLVGLTAWLDHRARRLAAPCEPMAAKVSSGGSRPVSD